MCDKYYSDYIETKGVIMTIKSILSALFNGLFVAPKFTNDRVVSDYRNQIRIRLGA